MTLGPYGVEEMRRHVTRGKVGREDWVCVVGTEAWVAASEAPGIRESFPTVHVVPTSASPSSSRPSVASSPAGLPTMTVKQVGTPPTTSDRWLVRRNGTVLGPFPMVEIQSYLADGRLHGTDNVAAEGSEQWVPITTFLGPPRTPQAPPPPAVVPSRGSERSWYVMRNGESVGPWSLGDLQRALARAEVHPDDQICENGGVKWMDVRTVLEPLAHTPAALPAVRLVVSSAQVPRQVSALELLRAVGTVFAMYLSQASVAEHRAFEQRLGLTGRQRAAFYAVGLSASVAMIATFLSMLILIGGEKGSGYTTSVPPSTTVPQPGPAGPSRRYQPLENVVVWHDFRLCHDNDMLCRMSSHGFRVCARETLHNCRLRVGRRSYADSQLRTREFTPVVPVIDTVTSCESQAEDALRLCRLDGGGLDPQCRQRFGVFDSHDSTVNIDQRDLFLRDNEVQFSCDEGYIRQ